MPETKNSGATPSVSDQLTETFSKQVDRIANLHLLPELFMEFLQKASPEETELLMNTLSERCHGTITLAECMRLRSKPPVLHEEEPAAQQGSAPNPEPDLPEWLTETPSMKYTLEACPSTGGIDQAVEMTLEEYDALKEHLAKMRGYAVPAEEETHAS